MMTRYETVAQEIRKLIHTGHWKPGDRIPPEPQLCQQFQVSRTTIRQAVQILSLEGLLICRQGLGTFVLKPETARKPLGLSDFTSQIIRGQLRIQREVLVNRVVSADEELTRMLKIPPGTPVRIVERLDRLDDQPLSTDRCIIPISWVDKLTDMDFASPLFSVRWEQKQNLVIDHIDQSLHTEAPTSDDCRYLGIRPETWMLILSELYFIADGRIVGLIISRYRGDTCKLTTRLSRSQMAFEEKAAFTLGE